MGLRAYSFTLLHSKTNQTGVAKPDSEKPILNGAADALSSWLSRLDWSRAWENLVTLWTSSYSFAEVLVAPASSSASIFKHVGADNYLPVASRIPIASAG